MFPHSKR